jgi:hypothetical protein
MQAESQGEHAGIEAYVVACTSEVLRTFVRCVTGENVTKRELGGELQIE